MKRNFLVILLCLFLVSCNKESFVENKKLPTIFFEENNQYINTDDYVEEVLVLGIMKETGEDELNILNCMHYLEREFVNDMVSFNVIFLNENKNITKEEYYNEILNFRTDTLYDENIIMDYENVIGKKNKTNNLPKLMIIKWDKTIEKIITKESELLNEEQQNLKYTDIKNIIYNLLNNQGDEIEANIVR